MAHIVNLDELVPEDVVFSFRGQDFAIPGDIDVEMTFRLLQLLKRAGVAEEQDDLDAQQRVNIEMRDALLDLFKQRDSSLDELPFGVIAFKFILSEVLQAMGLVVPAAEDPTKGKGTPKKSPRSTGSRRSSKSSASRRKK